LRFRDGRTTYVIVPTSERVFPEYYKAIQLDPELAEPYNNRGIAKLNLKVYEEAIADFTKSIEINSNYP
jgi:tetratricopeptide (TPR) repeat protein